VCISGIHMPDRDSSSDMLTRFSRQQEAVQKVVPEFGAEKFKIVLEENILENESFNFSTSKPKAPDEPSRRNIFLCQKP
jgi:hypothetical protein